MAMERLRVQISSSPGMNDKYNHVWKVKVQDKISGEFQTDLRLRHWDALSAQNFNLVLGKFIRSMEIKNNYIIF